MVQRDAASRINLHSVNLEPLTADPTDSINGDIWYRSDLGELHVNIAGTVKKIVPATI